MQTLTHAQSHLTRWKRHRLLALCLYIDDGKCIGIFMMHALCIKSNMNPVQKACPAENQDKQINLHRRAEVTVHTDRGVLQDLKLIKFNAHVWNSSELSHPEEGARFRHLP